MALIYRLFIVFFSLLSLSAIAQTNQEIMTNRAIEKAMGWQEAIETPNSYKEASLLIDSAIDKLQKGDVNKAEELVRQSIALYPTFRVFDYIKQICRMSDINKARLIMDELYEKVHFQKVARESCSGTEKVKENEEKDSQNRPD